MDIRKELLKGYSKTAVLKIVRYVGANQNRFNELVDNYLKGPYRTTQRASGPIAYCIQLHPDLVKPHLKKILDVLEEQETYDAMKRNTMRLLQYIEIPEKHREQVINLGFRFLQSKKEPVAVKVFSMTVLSHIVDNIPDLKRELRFVIEDQLPFSSAAFKSRAKKVLMNLNNAGR